MVQNPVGMTWDSRGRLWVVELYEYPEGTPLPIEKRPFGGEATDGDYHPVPAKCQAKDNPAAPLTSFVIGGAQTDERLAAF